MRLALIKSRDGDVQCRLTAVVRSEPRRVRLGTYMTRLACLRKMSIEFSKASGRSQNLASDDPKSQF